MLCVLHITLPSHAAIAGRREEGLELLGVAVGRKLPRVGRAEPAGVGAVLPEEGTVLGLLAVAGVGVAVEPLVLTAPRRAPSQRQQQGQRAKHLPFRSDLAMF